MQKVQHLISLLLWTNLVVGSAPVKYQKRQAADCSTPVQRRSWTALSNEERTAYLNAERCLQETPAAHGIPGARSVWDELQWAHIRIKNWAHGTYSFLPWHRFCLATHERLLAKHCNYNLGAPYWEMSLDVENMAGAAVWDPQFGFGGNGRAGDNCVADGPFSSLTLIFDDDGIARDPYCLQRRFDPEVFKDAAQSQIDTCFASPDWLTAGDCYQQFLHFAGHAGIRGTMGNPLLSLGDPIFIMHHVNLDRLWWLWQLAGLPGRLTEMGGRNTPTDEFNAVNGWPPPGPEWTTMSGDDGRETTLDHVLWMAEIMPNTTIREVMDLRGPVSCAEYV